MVILVLRVNSIQIFFFFLFIRRVFSDKINGAQSSNRFHFKTKCNTYFFGGLLNYLFFFLWQMKADFTEY